MEAPKTIVATMTLATPNSTSLLYSVGMKAKRQEGPKMAREKFERTMKALFRVPKAEVKDEVKQKIYKPRKPRG